MIDLIKAILFAKTVLLTPAPINIGPDSIEIQIDKPVTALTQGARIEIQISNTINRYEYGNIQDLRKEIDEKIPKGSITGILVDASGSATTFIYKGNISVAKEQVRLSLEAINKLDLDKNFSRIVLKSDTKLNNVSVYWRNYRK